MRPEGDIAMMNIDNQKMTYPHDISALKGQKVFVSCTHFLINWIYRS